MEPAVKEIVQVLVTKPGDCPFCSECSCNLNLQIEGPTVADTCPEGRYPNYKFPSDCPLIKNDYTIKKGTIDGTIS